jgi:nucleoside 2-deoxyribosyltransferase
MAAVYLAGPDVFLADAIDVGRVKKAHCSDHGLVGVFPLDAELALTRQDGISERIFNANVTLMRQCAAVVANITPFRGLSVDPGTAFEVGFAFALGKPVFAYTNVATNYRDRVVDAFGAGAQAEGREFAGDGMSVENFGLVDNLMIAEAVRSQGWEIVVRDVSPERSFTDLEGFDRCLRQAAAFFRSGRNGAAAA